MKWDYKSVFAFHIYFLISDLKMYIAKMFSVNYIDFLLYTNTIIKD